MHSPTLSSRLSRSVFRRPVVIGMAGFALACGLFSMRVSAQGTTGTAATTPDGAPAEGGVSILSLFSESFDLFTILLVVCSLAAWTIIVKCVIEIRPKSVASDAAEYTIREMARAGSWNELRRFVAEDDSLYSRAIAAGLDCPVDDKGAVRDAAELAASEEVARWFRKIEPLNVLGNLGPLLGLAGTVWGMVIAFSALGQAGGQASPATLSLGISKALFHTLLGLLLAVPALAVFGMYRGVVDRLCNRALVVAGALVELLPASAAVRGADVANASPAAAFGQRGRA